MKYFILSYLAYLFFLFYATQFINEFLEKKFLFEYFYNCNNYEKKIAYVEEKNLSENQCSYDEEQGHI